MGSDSGDTYLIRIQLDLISQLLTHIEITKRKLKSQHINRRKIKKVINKQFGFFFFEWMSQQGEEALQKEYICPGGKNLEKIILVDFSLQGQILAISNLRRLERVSFDGYLDYSGSAFTLDDGILACMFMNFFHPTNSYYTIC
eukprot:TRINITY_DN7971_c0_g2_i1.p3 TRINITY_DN7971_c0_g2~~TRINITY_DN7971_c0_g2_i1.p3  ORF type:complete len:143 (-),score=11.88 TRINITY_DN7971_c0_g2_i1:658-1086(-)